ncbi:membrane protein [Cystobacter fuscus DSM 2262]|uniref:Membrane protein n=1 Tax=Cystobacter fuscus (strain ATCC 25194 / DSM 2262 / NBRC 100088 / M29) TaxID=1242864 RepID=S9QRC3_CYSF2|nr:DoxX family protein [Cystobacter fuscus]EPX63859.1 membrane protein [Cystobacter fuscus DSM 2262]
MSTPVDASAPSSPHAAAAPPTGKAMLWTGRVLSGLSVALFLMSAVMKLSQNPQVVQGWQGQQGYPLSTLVPIGVVELLCVVLYAVPRTAVLGALLLTAYLGGAVATHVRISDPFTSPIIIGVVVWAGLYLRDARIRALVPLRRDP